MIKKINSNIMAPVDLMLLADPSKEQIKSYQKFSTYFVTLEESKRIYYVKYLYREQGYKSFEIGTESSSIHQLQLCQRCDFRQYKIDVIFLESTIKKIYMKTGLSVET